MRSLLKKVLFCAVIVLVITTVSACVPVVFATGALVGGTVITDSRSPQTMVIDHDIAYKVQAKLRQNRNLLGKSRIVATSFNKILLLVGQVPTEAARNAAGQIASSIPKVQRVYSGIEIGKPISTSVQAHDSWVTTKVKAALLAEKGLHSAQIKIITEDGVVYMLGITTKHQGELAAIAASKVQEVKKVVKLFEYTART